MVGKDFYTFQGPREKGIIGEVLKFAIYVHQYKSLPRNIFGFIVNNKMDAIGHQGVLHILRLL